MNEHRPAKNATSVSVAEAKARFSELLKRAAAGEEIHLTRHGRPYAKLGPDRRDEPKLPRVGAFSHLPLKMAEGWDELGPEWDEYIR